MFGFERHAVPAALEILPVGFLEACGRAHDAVLQPATLAVPGGVDRRQHLAGELAGLLQNLGDRVRRRQVAAVERRQALEPGDLSQREQHVADRRGVAAHGTTLPGFMIPLGSIACLSVRISPISMGER